MLVLDGSSPMKEEDVQALGGLAPHLLVLSKGDLPPVLSGQEVADALEMCRRSRCARRVGKGWKNCGVLSWPLSPRWARNREL